jgi:tellurite resistance protein
MDIRNESLGSIGDGLRRSDPGEDLPCSGGCRARLLEAVIAAVAVAAQADGRIQPSERMAVMTVLSRTGLVEDAGMPAALAGFADCVAALQAGRVSLPQLLSRRMNMLVGAPWSVLVVRAAEEVAEADGPLCPEEEGALLAIRRAAGVLPPPMPRRLAERPEAPGSRELRPEA